MRRGAFLLVAMALAMVMASGVALAVNKVGTDGPDTLRGTNRSDTLVGRGGQDTLWGEGGSDNLLGGPGKDNVIGGNERRAGGGDLNLVGGPGNDEVNTGLGSDNALGGRGNDLLVEGAFREVAKDTYAAGSGNDVILANNRPAARDVVVCGGGLDRVLADRRDVVAGDCEWVYFGLGDREFFRTKVPQSFFEGLGTSPFA